MDPYILTMLLLTIPVIPAVYQIVIVLLDNCIGKYIV